ncbi:hypothetical protein APS_0195 [Acetobacter pasteurianus subsp. pasteurianus LMG 1262 = NBRC 106471]|nr:hypothetical protein APS_0195 [Acetobacter pasteurianus subsp. pasteurianus LMG 1262 = NBRC 106471]
MAIKEITVTCQQEDADKGKMFVIIRSVFNNYISLMQQIKY